MGKQSKFSPELVQQILAEIEKTGSDHSGYEAGGISADTFYKWLKQKPEWRFIDSRDLHDEYSPLTLAKYGFGSLDDYRTQILTY